MQVIGVKINIGEGLLEFQDYDTLVSETTARLDEEFEIPGGDQLVLNAYDNETGVGYFFFPAPVEEDNLMMFFLEEELIFPKKEKLVS